MTIAVHTGGGTMRVNSSQIAVAGSLELGSGLTSGAQSILQFENDSQLSLTGPLTLYRQATIKGAGHLSAPASEIHIPFFAEVQVAAGETLKLTGTSLELDGTANIIGTASSPASWEVNAPALNGQPAGLIRAENAHLTFPQGLTNSASVLFQSGNSIVSGPFTSTGNGTQSVSPGAEVTFQDAVSVTRIGGLGKVTVEASLQRSTSPGALVFGGDLCLADSSTLEVQLGGLTAGTQHDQVSAASELTLGGTLKVTLTNGHLASLGDSYAIHDAGTFSGDFASYSLPVLAQGLHWQVSQLALTGELLVGNFPDNYDLFAATFALAGDFDEDDDGDGIANGIEYALGTDPTTANAETEALGLIHSSTHDILSSLLVTPAQHDITLTIETSTNLQDGLPDGWTALATRANGTWSTSPAVTVTPQSNGQALIEVTNSAMGDLRRFYRLKATLAP